MKFDKLKEERAINTAERIQHAIAIMEAVREGKIETYNPETHVAVPRELSETIIDTMSAYVCDGGDCIPTQEFHDSIIALVEKD